MREVSFEESKIIMVNILVSIDKCCRENNIKYSLCWGTMIGAIRHHGFIPWDDDIDLMMSREDYNRFIEVYNDSEYDVYTPKVDKNCIQPMTKICDKKTCVYLNNHSKSLFGVWVSIFPYDNAPDVNIAKWEKKRDFWLKLYHIKTCQSLKRQSLKRRMAKIVAKLLLSPYSSFWINNRIESCLTAFNNQQTKRICIWFGTPYMKYRYYPKELLDGYIDVDFEQMKVMIIKGYDEFLRSTYGDYMEFPPESEQTPKHNYRAYFLE
jgi:lipopolysaccharide cholinephosphotransferase